MIQIIHNKIQVELTKIKICKFKITQNCVKY